MSDQTQPTRRRLEMLLLAANGRTNREIATTLGIDENTVKSHFRVLFRLLGARDRTQAVVIGIQRGWVPITGATWSMSSGPHLITCPAAAPRCTCRHPKGTRR